jgi:syntaxin 8
VRFRDNPSQESLDAEDETNRAALFPARYTDDDSDRAKTPDPVENMSNTQIHAYHQQVISEQDEQLDRLGESIGRQRHLAMQVGDELEGQIGLLDEVDRGVDRHQGRLDGAKRRLKGVSETAKKNWGMTTIIILIVILVLLIVLLK